MNKCVWCGKVLGAEQNLFCSPEHEKAYTDCTQQRKQCANCEYREYIRYSGKSQIACGYILKKKEMRNCGINPCEKFKKRTD